MGFFKNLFEGLKKTREALVYKLEVLFKGTELNDEFYEELEYILIGSDISASVSGEIIEQLQQKVKRPEGRFSAKYSFTTPSSPPFGGLATPP